MRLVRFLLLFTLSTPVAFPADSAEIAQKIADVQIHLPWFFSPIFEGLTDIPYTYQMSDTRTFADRKGKQTRPPSDTLIERIPLILGSYYRCLSQNGKTPCSPELAGALEAESQKAANFTAEEKAKATAARENRRVSRRAFWTDFSQAFRFREVAAGQLSFTPTGNYRPQGASKPDLLQKIEGQIWYNDRYEITRMDYRVLADAEPKFRLFKGSTFSVTLANVADNHFLPQKAVIRRPLPKGVIETAETEFSNFRVFAADSTVNFVDKDR
jgi:hypothetical protein